MKGQANNERDDMAAQDHAARCEALALDAESRIQDAPTQDEREYWQRMAAYWWGQA